MVVIENAYKSGIDYVYFYRYIHLHVYVYTRNTINLTYQYQLINNIYSEYAFIHDNMQASTWQ
jgi:hypothetical protein